MSESDLFAGDFNFILDQSADLYGQPMEIYAVNYNQVDGSPSYKSSQRLKMEKTLTSKLAQGEFRLLEYYSLYGYRYLYNSGDLIFPQDSNSSTPICTVVSLSPAEECIAVRTSLIGSIYNGTTPIFTTVYYELIGEGVTGSNQVQDMVYDRPILKHKFIIHKRELTSATVEEQGLIFYEEGEPGRPRWQITHSDSRGSLMILDCEKNIVV